MNNYRALLSKKDRPVTSGCRENANLEIQGGFGREQLGPDFGAKE